MAAIYWSSQAALPDLWQAVFGYNLAYVSDSNFFASVWEAFDQLTTQFPLSVIFMLAVGLFWGRLGYCWRTLRSLFVIEDKEGADQQPYDSQSMDLLEVGICLALPLNVLIVNLSGRNYGHYYQAIIPTLVIGSALLWARIWHGLRNLPEARGISFGLAGVVIALVVGWGLNLRSQIVPELEQVMALLEPETYLHVEQDPIVDFIQANTSSGDRVLVWGSEVSINFLSQRQSSSRYPSSLDVTLPGYRDEERFEEFFQSNEVVMPELIVFENASPISNPSQVGAQVVCRSCSKRVLPSFEQFRAWVLQSYTYLGAVGDWQVLSRMR
jgi:hypothetical protein